MSSEEAVIRDIRENYLVSDELGAESEKVRKGVKKLQETTAKAMERLSGELYAKDSHFILELLQNADDNQYDDGVKPSLCLTWNDAKQAIEVRNNERGFTEKNVRSLCAIGESTKADKSKGYIGEKGIGFKSVFKVADRVYVASNGYRFVFDATRPLGMIVPEWVAESQFPTSCEDDSTVFFLSLKETIDKVALKKQCQELHPYLLLFLKKVQKLEVSISGKRKVFERIGELPFVEIQQSTDYQGTYNSEEKIHHFLVREQEFSKLPRVEEPKRPNVTRTTITIAFPLETCRDGDPVAAFQNVYAFLPLRSHGFKFIIQADFLLSASREDVIEDNAWNLFIRDNIAVAFIKAAAMFKDSSQEISRQISLVSYLPRPNNITNEFFRVVATNIISKLRSEAVILSCDGNWHTPNTIFNLPDLLTLSNGRVEDKTALIPNDELFRIQKGEYIHDQYRWDKHGDLLEDLGCKTLSFLVFVTCLNSLDFASMKLSMQWYRTVTNYVAEEHHKWIRNIPLSYLAGLQIYVLQSEVSTKLLEGGHFFFPPKDKDFSRLDKSLLFLHPDSLTPSSYKFLSSLKVKYPKVGELAEAIVALYARIPNIQSVRSQNQLLVHVAFLQWHVDNLGNNEGKKLRFNLVLMDDEGRYMAPRQLYIKTKGAGYDLKDIFPPTISAIHDQYISLAKDDTKLEQRWISFLVTNCGVNRAVSLENGCLPKWLVTKLAGDSSGDIGVKLLAMMAEMWREVYEPVFKKNQKTFCQELAKMRVPCVGGKVVQLGQTALPTSKIQSVFEDSLTYVKVEDPDDKKWEFLKFLSVSVTVDVHIVLKVLEGMSDRKENTIKAAENLYKYLDVHFNEAREVIKNSFASKSLIIVEDRAKNSVEWRKSADVLWDGEKTVFRSEPFLMDSLPQCQEFFVTKLSIRSAEVQDLDNMISCLPKSLDCSEIIDDLSEHMACTYQYLSNWIRVTEFKKSDQQWLDRFLKKPIFLVKYKNNKRVMFIKNNGQIFVEDEPALADLFQGTIQTLSVPPNFIPIMQEFINVITSPRLRRLSNIEPVQMYYTGDTIDDDWTDAVRKCVPFCARVLYSKHSENWDALLNQMMFRLASSHLTVWRVDKIVYTYAIGKNWKELDKLVALKKDTASIDIWMSSSFDEDDVHLELVKLLCDLFDPKSSELGRLLENTLNVPMIIPRLEKFAQKYNLLEIPTTFGDIFSDASSIVSVVKKELTVTYPKTDVSEKRSEDLISAVVSEKRSKNPVSAHPETDVSKDPISTYPETGVSEKRSKDLISTYPEMGVSEKRSKDPISTYPEREVLEKQSKTMRQPAEQRYQSEITTSYPDKASYLNARQRNMIETDARSSFGDQHDMSQGIYDPSRLFLPNEQDIHLAGVLGEAFVYEYYSDILPGFNLRNWVSHLRDEYITLKWDDTPPVDVASLLEQTLELTQADREVECDFKYKDIQGLLGEMLGLPAIPVWEQRTFFLEVKATTMKASEPFTISSREWMYAQRLSSFESRSESKTLANRVYVIVRVDNVKSSPSIVKTLIDPWALWKRGEMDVHGKDWIVSKFM